MLQQLRDFISYFENSALADNIRENDVLFPLIESLHVVSICLVVGSIFAVDLRLLGLASTDRSVSRVTNGILPLTWTAFAVAVASGSLLFISNATKYLGNDYFDAKILLICAAGLNMAMFHALSSQGPTPMGERYQAATSGTAGGRIVHSAVGCGGRMWALDRLYYGGSLT